MAVHFDIFVAVRGTPRFSFRATALNLSLGGMKIRTADLTMRQYVDLSQRQPPVRVEIPESGMLPAMGFDGAIKWQRVTPRPGHNPEALFGLQWDALLPQQHAVLSGALERLQARSVGHAGPDDEAGKSPERGRPLR